MMQSTAQSPLRSPVNRVTQVLRSLNVNPARLFGSVAGRSGLCYTSANGGVSWDDLIAQNEAALAAGRPQDCQLFSDSAGTVPVLSPIGEGQGLGLLLDRSQGLTPGPELVTNGDFSSGTTGWAAIGSATISALSDAASVNVTGSSGGIVSSGQSFGFVAGNMYQASFDIDISGMTPGGVEFRVGLVGVLGLTTSGTKKVSFLPTTSNSTISFQRASGSTGTFTIDNISVRELPGNHLQQPTAVARGEFQTASGAAYLRRQTDDWAKAALSPEGATKAVLIFPVKKIDNTAAQVLCEYGPDANTTDGTFSLESPVTGGANEVVLRVRGASAGTTITGALSASVPAVIRAEIDLANQRQELWINGVSQGVSTTTIGATSFASREFFVGCRNGSSRFGAFDSSAPPMLIFLQPGDSLTDSQIRQIEKRFAKALGVTL